MKAAHVLRVFVVVVLLSGVLRVSGQPCPASCFAPDCSCPRFSHTMDTREIPQIVYFGFDDAVNTVMSSLYRRIFTKNRVNPNGCKMKMTLFVSHQYTDYRLVKRFYDDGNEIGVHSVTHTAIDDDDKLRREAKDQKDNIARVGVPLEEIKGWRSPFLKPAGNNQPQILKDLGYDYDISLTYSRFRLSQPKPWPFTMDNGWPYRCGVPPCPTSASVEKFWEVPVVSLMDYKNQYPCSFVDGCAIRATSENEAYNFLMNNFLSYYNTTRTPFGLNMHAAWFYTRYNLKAMMRFLDTLMTMKDVYVVTVSQMLDWMRNPTPLSEIHMFRPWQCPESIRLGFYRTLLSKSYSCEEVWQQQLKVPSLENVNTRAFALDILKKFEAERTISNVDMEIFAYKMDELKEKDYPLIEDILYKFRHSNESCPVNEAIYHATVRNFIRLGQEERLVELMKDRFSYGIFPDQHAVCLLIDHFILKKDYKNAAQIAYEVMIQEEFDHPTQNLLAVYAAAKHFCHTMDFKRPEPLTPDPEEEMQYIPKKLLWNPFYDDHFDIKDERFLLGKTLYMLGKETQNLDPVCCRSLQLIGLGLYEKFELANELLEQWISDTSLSYVVYEEALAKYTEYLDSAQTRDPDAEEKSMGERTVDDEIEKLKPTPQEKEGFISKLEELKEQLAKSRISLDTVDQVIEDFVWQGISLLEAKDIKKQLKKFKLWHHQRDIKIEKHREKEMKAIKQKQIKEKLVAMQEREELLTFFENKDEILSKMKEERTRNVEVDETEGYVEAPGERNVRLKIKKRK